MYLDINSIWCQNESEKANPKYNSNQLITYLNIDSI